MLFEGRLLVEEGLDVHRPGRLAAGVVDVVLEDGNLRLDVVKPGSSSQ